MIRGALPARCGCERGAMHVERASLLAEDAALRQAVRIFAATFGRSLPYAKDLRQMSLAGALAA
jgi:hypothetical protein